MSERWRRLFTLLVYPGSYFYQKEPQGILHLPLTWRSFALTSSALVTTLVLPELIIWNLLSLWHVSIVWIKLISFILTLMVLFLVLNKAGESLSSVGLAKTPLRGVVREIGVGLAVYGVFAACAVIYFSVAWGNGLAIILKNNMNVERAISLWVRAILVGSTEELIFRGWVLTFMLTRLRHPDLALIVSAVIFGLAHINQGVGNILFATLYGYLLGLLYLWRKSLIGPITMHALQNFGVWAFQLHI